MGYGAVHLPETEVPEQSSVRELIESGDRAVRSRHRYTDASDQTDAEFRSALNGLAEGFRYGHNRSQILPPPGGPARVGKSTQGRGTGRPRHRSPRARARGRTATSQGKAVVRREAGKLPVGRDPVSRPRIRTAGPAGRTLAGDDRRGPYSTCGDVKRRAVQQLRAVGERDPFDSRKVHSAVARESRARGSHGVEAQHRTGGAEGSEDEGAAHGP